MERESVKCNWPEQIEKRVSRQGASAGAHENEIANVARCCPLYVA